MFSADNFIKHNMKVIYAIDHNEQWREICCVNNHRIGCPTACANATLVREACLAHPHRIVKCVRCRMEAMKSLMEQNRQARLLCDLREKKKKAVVYVFLDRLNMRVILSFVTLNDLKRYLVAAKAINLQ